MHFKPANVIIHIHSHSFCGISKLCLKSAWQQDENISLVTLLLSVSPPVSLLFPLMYLNPRFSFYIPSSICPLFICNPLPFHFSIHLLQPFLPSFISPLFLHSVIYLLLSMSEHYRAVRVNCVPVSSTGQVMNLSPLWSLVTLSSFITQLSGGRTEWDGDWLVWV